MIFPKLLVLYQQLIESYSTVVAQSTGYLLQLKQSHIGYLMTNFLKERTVLPRQFGEAMFP